MGGYTGKYSRNPFSVFNEEKNYAFALMQEGIPVTDDDSNDDRLELFTRQRRMAQLFGEYGTPNAGFKIQESSSPANNFEITGGGPSNTDIELAGRFFMKGISCLLLKDVEFVNSLVDLAEQSIHARVTNVYWDGSTYTVVEDSAANWEIDEHNGKIVTIDGSPYTVADTTQDELKISGNQAALISDGLGEHYQIELTTSSGRTDAVYLNVYLDEYDGTDDPDINKEIGGTSVEAQLRAKVIQTIYVREAITGPTELTDYVDANGNQHFVFKLATLARTASADILASMITDHVPTIGFEDIGIDRIIPLRPSTNVDDTKISVAAGKSISTDGVSLVEYAGGATAAFSGQATDARWDVVVLRDDATLDIIEGVAAASPTKPDFGSAIPIAYAYVDESPAAITASDIDDARALFTPGSGWTVLNPEFGNLETQITGTPSGKRFWLSPGTYLVGSSNLNFGDDCLLVGQGDSTVIQLVNVGEIACIDRCRFENITFESTAINATKAILILGGDYCEVTRCVFNESTGTRNSAISFGVNANHCRVVGCSFLRVGESGTDPAEIKFQAGTTNRNNEVRDCYIQVGNVAGAAGIFGEGHTVSTLIENCEFVFSTTAVAMVGIALDSNWTVRDCYFGGNSTATVTGIKADITQFDNVTIDNCVFNDCRRLFHAPSTTSGGSFRNTISNNKFVASFAIASTVYAIQGEYIKQSVFRDNVIDCSAASSDGIKVTNGSDGNKFIGNTLNLGSGADSRSGIWSSGDYVLVSGNAITATSTDNIAAGVQVSGDDVRVLGNTITVTGGAGGAFEAPLGISVVGAGCVISGNTVSVASNNSTDDPGGICIYLSSCANPVITNNTLGDSGGTGNDVMGFLSSGSSVYIVFGHNTMISGFATNYAVDFGSDTGIYSGNIYKNAPQNVGSATAGTNLGVA